MVEVVGKSVVPASRLLKMLMLSGCGDISVDESCYGLEGSCVV